MKNAYEIMWVVSIAIAITLATLWGGSYSFRPPENCLKLGEIYVAAEDGRVRLSSRVDEEGRPQVLRTPIVRPRPFPRVIRSSSFAIAGVDFRFYYFDSGKTIFSLDLSMLIPTGFVLFCAIYCFRRHVSLKRFPVTSRL
jgi:hypothetical protein